jgi:hypothetical protein
MTTNDKTKTDKKELLISSLNELLCQCKPEANPEICIRGIK